MSVTFVRDGISFVGDASPAVFDRLLGMELGLEEWVDALGGGFGNLPARLVLQGDGQKLTMELRRRQPAPADVRTLGIGRPPPGTELRALDDLLQQPDRFDLLENEDSSL